MNIITNKSGKIIHLGSMMLLPGESGELPKAYENNPVVSFLEGRSFPGPGFVYPAKGAALRDICHEERAYLSCVDFHRLAVFFPCHLIIFHGFGISRMSVQIQNHIIQSKSSHIHLVQIFVFHRPHLPAAQKGLSSSGKIVPLIKPLCMS